MKIFIRYIVDIIISLLKRAWYHAKMKMLKEELAKEKEEANEAIKEASDAVDDFESDYKLFLDNESKSAGVRPIESDQSSNSDVQRDVEEVRDSGGKAEESD